MKKIIFLLGSLLLSTTSFASDCYKDICVGDTVIDMDSGLKEGVATMTLADGTIHVRASDGSTWKDTYPYFATTKQRCIRNEICIGEYVYDLDSNLKRVKIIAIQEKTSAGSVYVYLEEDGVTKGQDTFPYFALERSDLCARNLCVGDEVYDSDSSSTFGNAIIIAIKKSSGDAVFLLRYQLGSKGTDTASYLRLVKRSAEVLRAQAEEEKLRQEKEELANLVAQGIADETVYNTLRAQNIPHNEALERASGPTWLGPQHTEKFLLKLSQFVYQFDRLYYQELAKIVSNKDSDTERRNVFLAVALLPQLKAFSYTGLKEKHIDRSAKQIETMMNSYGMQNLQSIESSTLTRRMSLQMLAASLRTSQTQMNEGQKRLAESYLRSIGDLLATPLRYRDFQNFFRLIPEYKRLLLELVQNPYLGARMSTDMALLDYLENS